MAHTRRDAILCRTERRADGHVPQVSPETAMREWQTEDVVVEGTDERLPRTE